MANIGSVRSITQVGTYEPFELQVARGQITGHSTVNIYGFQNSVTTTWVPVWENAAVYAYPGSAVAMTVASSTTTADAGVKIQVQGLDANYAVLNETVTLNASGTATTTGLFLRINALVTTSGNATGVITAKNGGVTYAQIATTVGRSQMSLYTVPAGYTFYLSRIDAYSATSGFTADYMYYRNAATSFAGVSSQSQQAPFTNNYHAQRVMPRAFAEKTDIQLQCKTSANTYAVSIAAEGFLVANYITGSVG